MWIQISYWNYISSLSRLRVTEQIFVFRRMNKICLNVKYIRRYRGGRGKLYLYCCDLTAPWHRDNRWQFTNLLWLILCFPSDTKLPSLRIIYFGEFEKQTGTFVKLFSHFWLWIAASCRNPKIYFLKIFISSPDFFLYDVIGIQLLVYKKA